MYPPLGVEARTLAPKILGKETSVHLHEARTLLHEARTLAPKHAGNRGLNISSEAPKQKGFASLKCFGPGPQAISYNLI